MIRALSYSDMPAVWWAKWFEAYGLPAPEKELQFSEAYGYRLDLGWRGPKLGVEIHGGIWKGSKGDHTSGKGRLRDMKKIREAQIRGWVVLEVTPEEVKSGELASLVQRALLAIAYRWRERGQTQTEAQGSART